MIEVIDAKKGFFHLNVLIFELQKHKIFYDQVEKEIIKNSAFYSNTIKEKWKWRTDAQREVEEGKTLN